MRVVLSPAARRDRREAELWYRSASAIAVMRFRSDLQAAIEFISDYPHGAPVFRGSVRAKTLVKFPYSILYIVLRDRIRVLAIADERREPGTYDHRS